MRRIALLLASTALVVLLASGVALATVASQIGTTAAAGTTIVVNSKGDGAKTGNCTLREAIQAANSNASVDGCEAGSSTERDAIHFSIGEEATIVLGSQLPTITDPSGLTINGQKKADIAVSGNDEVRVFEVGSGAQLNLNHLTVAHGSAEQVGGGLSNEDGTVRVRNSTFSGNSARRAGPPSGGGGIYNEFGTLKVTNSTFSANSASAGGGIYNTGGPNNNVGTLEMTNSTFSENSADPTNGDPSGGGGIWNAGTLKVTNSTFSENSADGINNSGGTATLRNTIVANSSSGGNCAGSPMTDGSYNIDDGISCGFSEANNSMPSTDPLLAESLANNGGPTKTIALKKGSPAINAIPKTTNGCGTEVKTDQRGVKRPQGKKCDISAFEKKVVRR